MSEKPDYRFKMAIVDQNTGAVVISDWCSVGLIGEFGQSEAIDMHVASTLRAFERAVRGEYERVNYPEPEPDPSAARVLGAAVADLRRKLAAVNQTQGE